MRGDLLVVGVRRLRGQPTRYRGPYASRLLADPEALVRATRAALADDTWTGTGPWRAGFDLRIFDGLQVRHVRSAVDRVRDQAPVPALLRLVWHLDDRPLSAAEGLASLCDVVAGATPQLDGAAFVTRLAEQAAGISPGRAGWVDLARAGTNTLPGTGFREEYDDGTLGQVRHFAGSAAATLRLGSRATRWASLLRGDLPGSPDHQLTLRAVEFTDALTRGALRPSDAGAWVRRHLLPSG